MTPVADRLRILFVRACAAVILLLATGVLVGYAVGVEEFYRRWPSMPGPMALSTAVAFAAIGLALLAIADMMHRC